MLPTWLIPLLLELLPQVPQLAADGENVFASVVHGEGGVQKVSAALTGLANLTQHGIAAVNTVAANIPAAPPVPPPPPPPQSPEVAETPPTLHVPG